MLGRLRTFEEVLMEMRDRKLGCVCGGGIVFHHTGIACRVQQALKGGRSLRVLLVVCRA